MAKILYEPLYSNDGGDGNYAHEVYTRFRGLSLRQRFRLHIGGLLFMGIGIYILYKTLLLVGSEFPPGPSGIWRDTRYLFVFGDSYSSTGYVVDGPHPNDGNPLGNPSYPGITSAYGPNWVDFIVTEFNKSVVLAHDFAVSGATIGGVEAQVNGAFLPFAGRKPSWAPWTDKNSLFLTWLGINDINRWMDIDVHLALLFELQEALYQAGARRFVFINVPAFHRAPTKGISPDYPPPDGRAPDLPGRIAEWNSELLRRIRLFRDRHPDVLVVHYDSFAMFTEILDNPESFGFRDAITECVEQDCFWADFLHPTSAVHWILAGEISAYLDRL